MKTIIAPTDFTTVSENACMYAAKLAADINAELVLLHVMELPVAVAEYPVSEAVFDEEEMEEELENLKSKIATATQNKVQIRTVNLLGSTEYQIQELCKEEHPFAVVIATHSYSALERFFSGSTTFYSAKHLRYPVIVVPYNVQYQPIKKIAFACDLRDVYEVPINEIEDIVKLFKADLDVFYAGKNEAAFNATSIEASFLDHRLHIARHRFHDVQSDDILLGIMSLAKEYRTDLLIVLSKKHGPFHKSQTKDFVLYSNIPLMALHEDDLVPKE
jgi:nucleotide-binding universal stress UspA family protein